MPKRSPTEPQRSDRHPLELSHNRLSERRHRSLWLVAFQIHDHVVEAVLLEPSKVATEPLDVGPTYAAGVFYLVTGSGTVRAVT